MFWIGLGIGTIVGCIAGVTVIALCVAGKTNYDMNNL